MPNHGLLSCAIEIGESSTRLREYGSSYFNRTVETYVAIPSKPTPFSIRLSTNSYVAPGLSIWVYVDGMYQTNRNKRGAEPPDGKLEFHLGQKEDLLKDGRVIARGWWFEKLNIVNGKTKPTINEDVLDNLGTIEVVVLRCEDDPNNAPVDPWSFPQLPSTEMALAKSNLAACAEQEKNQTGGNKAPSAEDDNGGGLLGGLFGGLDGAGDEDSQHTPRIPALDGIYEVDDDDVNQDSWHYVTRTSDGDDETYHKVPGAYRNDLRHEDTDGGRKRHVTYRHLRRGERRKTSRGRSPPYRPELYNSFRSRDRLKVSDGRIHQIHQRSPSPIRGSRWKTISLPEMVFRHGSGKITSSKQNMEIAEEQKESSPIQHFLEQLELYEPEYPLVDIPKAYGVEGRYEPPLDHPDERNPPPPPEISPTTTASRQHEDLTQLYDPETRNAFQIRDLEQKLHKLKMEANQLSFQPAHHPNSNRFSSYHQPHALHHGSGHMYAPLPFSFAPGTQQVGNHVPPPPHPQPFQPAHTWPHPPLWYPHGHAQPHTRDRSTSLSWEAASWGSNSNSALQSGTKDRTKSCWGDTGQGNTNNNQGQDTNQATDGWPPTSGPNEGSQKAGSWTGSNRGWQGDARIDIDTNEQRKDEDKFKGNVPWDNNDNEQSKSQASHENSSKSSDSNKQSNNPAWDSPGDNNEAADGYDWNGEGDKKKAEENESKKKSKKSSKKKSRRRSSSSTSSDQSEEKPYTRSYWHLKGRDNKGEPGADGQRRYTIPEETIYTVSKSEAKAKQVKHQVRGGKGAEQEKRTYKPVYWDSLEEPYAVFRFKYRSRDMLKKILGEDISESKEEYKEWISSLSKEQLIEEMLKKRRSEDADSSDTDDEKESKRDDKNGGNASKVGDDTWNKPSNDNPAWSATPQATNNAGGDAWNGGGGGGGGEPITPHGGW